MREAVFISCWHQSEFESDAMWKLYAPKYGGIAIKSNCQRLVECFRCDDAIFISAVSYVNYDTTHIPEGNALSPYVFKRQEFNHEHEVRAVSLILEKTHDQDTPGRSRTTNGVCYSVDLNVLIEEIRVDPIAEPWFFDLVCSVVDRYDLNISVFPSALADEPVW